MAYFDGQVEISLHEIYQINNQLREENRTLGTHLDKGRQIDAPKATCINNPLKWIGRWINTLLVSIPLGVISVAIVLVLVILYLKDADGNASLEAEINNLQQKKRLGMSLLEDVDLQEYNGPDLKRSFPDMDYALLGYNILWITLCPRFTYPIFCADYNNNDQNADCRYSVPWDIVLIPAVSCVASFSSKIVKTQYELRQSLLASANVGGGVLGSPVLSECWIHDLLQCKM